MPIVHVVCIVKTKSAKLIPKTSLEMCRVHCMYIFYMLCFQLDIS